MSGRITRKRARVDSSVDTNESNESDVQIPEEDVEVPNDVTQQPSQDEEFWFEDGTVVLVAGDVQFKVYKGILAEHSPVFKDMFSLPQPSQPAEHAAQPTTPFGTSVVHLTDSSEDFRHILRLQMPRRDTRPFTAIHPSFHVISACVRLGHKYQMDHLVEEGMSYLQGFYSGRFKTFTDGHVYSPPNFDEEHSMGVVNLLRLVDRRTMLPAAIIACCWLDGTSLVNGFEREDGSWETLTPEDLALCIQAKGDLTRASVVAALRICAPATSKLCKTKDACWQALQTFFNTISTRAHRISSVDPMTTYVGKARTLRICSDCLRCFIARDDSERWSVWKTLPQLVGVEVDGWDAVPEE
ncbi:hypothetical protein C8Q79DRAFT_920597 [Trametes meyenii]|nr:hypothetical protein C8Q79DRAFT_920597 [Trametes meyenii]